MKHRHIILFNKLATSIILHLTIAISIKHYCSFYETPTPLGIYIIYYYIFYLLYYIIFIIYIIYIAYSSFFFYSILRWSVAVSTMRRQSSRIAAFLQADARPMFCWPTSASTARSQVWLGLPGGRFQSGGSPRITAATARWWSSCHILMQHISSLLAFVKK